MEIKLLDLILTPIYFVTILIFASGYQKRKEKLDPVYKYFTRGLIVKMLGAISICMVYTYYYKGGDTTVYFNDALCLLNSFSKSPEIFFKLLFGEYTAENFSIFDESTGVPVHWENSQAIFSVRFFVPFCLLGCRSFIVSAILVGVFCYSGIWKLFQIFSQHFPHLINEFQISILYIPSVVFWGSGLLKDTVTISAVGWYTYGLYYFFILKKSRVNAFIVLLFSTFLIISIKPYILFALLPGSILWIFDARISKLKSQFIKALASPVFLALSLVLGVYILSQLGGVLGLYKIDSVMERAYLVQSDLKQEYYGGHTFDLGEFSPTFQSMMGKAPQAISAALFRPYLWDVKNPVMFLSALENTYILLLTITLLIRLKVVGIFIQIRKNPLVMFSVFFSLFFAFAVGIATPNFGALVRLRIPCLPFFVSSLFILSYLYKNKQLKFGF